MTSSSSSSDTDGEWNIQEQTFQSGMYVPPTSSSSAAAAAAAASSSSNKRRRNTAPYYTVSGGSIDAAASLARKWSRSSSSSRRAQLRATLHAWEFICNSIHERAAAEKSGPEVFARFRAVYADQVFATSVLQSELLPSMRQLAIVQEHSVQRGSQLPLLVTTLSLQLLSPALASLELRALHFGLPLPSMLELGTVTRAVGDSIPDSLLTLSLVDCVFPDVAGPITEHHKQIGDDEQDKKKKKSESGSSVLPAVPLLQYGGAKTLTAASAAAAATALAEQVDEPAPAAAAAAAASSAAAATGSAFDPDTAFSEMLQRGVEAANLSPLMPFVSNLPGCPSLLSRRSLRRLQIAGADSTIGSVLRAPHLACVANTLHELHVVGSEEVAEKMSVASTAIAAQKHLVGSGGSGLSDFERKMWIEQANARFRRELEQRQHQDPAAAACSPASSSSPSAAPSAEKTSSNDNTETEQQQQQPKKKKPIEVPLARAGSLNQSMYVNSYFQQKYKQQQQEQQQEQEENKKNNDKSTAASVAPPPPPVVMAASLSSTVSQRTMWPLLSRLTLRGLRWRTVSPVLGALPSLAIVDLSDNEIHTLLEPFPVLAQNSAITSINLSGNRLRHIGSGSEAGLPSSLTSLNLSRNFLQTFNRGGFPLGMPVLISLRELDVSHNLLLFWSDLHAVVHRSWTLRRVVLHHNPCFDGYLCDSAVANDLVQCPSNYPAELKYDSIEDVISVPASRAIRNTASSFSSSVAAANSSNNTSGPPSASSSNLASTVEQQKQHREHFVITAADLALLLFAYTDPACPQLETNGVLIKRSDANFSRAASLARMHSPFLSKMPYLRDHDDSDVGDGHHNKERMRKQHDALFLAPPSRHQLGAPGTSSRARTPAGGGRVVVRRVVRRRKVKRRSSSCGSGSSGTDGSSADDGDEAETVTSATTSKQSAGKNDSTKRDQDHHHQPSTVLSEIPPAASDVAHHTATMVERSAQRVLSSDQLPDPDSVDDSGFAAATAAPEGENPSKGQQQQQPQQQPEEKDASAADPENQNHPTTTTRQERAAVTHDRFSHLSPELHRFMDRLTNTLFAAEDPEHLPTMFAHPPKNIHGGALLVEIIYTQRPTAAESAAEHHHHHHHHHHHPHHHKNKKPLQYEPDRSFVFAIGAAEDTQVWKAALLKREMQLDVATERDTVLDLQLLATSTSSLHPKFAAEWTTVSEFRVGDPLANGGATKTTIVMPAAPKTEQDQHIPPPPPSLAQLGEKEHQQHSDAPTEEAAASAPEAAEGSAASASGPTFLVQKLPGQFRVACYIAVCGPPPQVEHAEKFLRRELSHACSDHDTNTGTIINEDEKQQQQLVTSLSTVPRPTLAITCTAGGRRPWPIQIIANLFHRGSVDGFNNFFSGERISCLSSVLVSSSSSSSSTTATVHHHSKHRSRAEKRRVIFQTFEKIVDRIPPYDFGSSLPGLVHGMVDQSVAVFLSCRCPQHHHEGGKNEGGPSSSSPAVVHSMHAWAEFLPERVLHLVPQDQEILQRFSRQKPSQHEPNASVVVKTSTTASGEVNAAGAARQQEEEAEGTVAAINRVTETYNKVLTMPVSILGATAGYVGGAAGYVTGYFSSSSGAAAGAVAGTDAETLLLNVNNTNSNSDENNTGVTFLCLDCFSQKDREAEQQQQQPLEAWWMSDIRNTLSHVSIAADGGSLTLYALHVPHISGPPRVTLTTNNATATFTLLWQLRNALHPVKLQIVVEPIEIHIPQKEDEKKAAMAHGADSSSSSSSPMIVGESLEHLSQERLLSRRLRHVEGCALSIVEPKWVGASHSSLSNALRQLEHDENEEEQEKKHPSSGRKEERSAAHAEERNDDGGHHLTNLFSGIAKTSRYFLGRFSHHDDEGGEHHHGEQEQKQKHSHGAHPAGKSGAAVAVDDEHQPAFLQYRAPGGGIKWSAGWFCEFSLVHEENEVEEDDEDEEDVDRSAQHRHKKKNPVLDTDDENVMFAFVVEEKDAAGEDSASGRRGHIAAILTREDVVVVEVPAASGIALADQEEEENDERKESAYNDAASAAPTIPLVFLISMRCANNGPDMLVCVAAQQRSSLLRMLKRLCTTSVEDDDMSTGTGTDPAKVAINAGARVNLLPVTSWDDRLPQAKKKA